MLVVADCSFMSSLNLGSRYKRKQSKRGMEGGGLRRLVLCGVAVVVRVGGGVEAGWWGGVVGPDHSLNNCCFS